MFARDGFVGRSKLEVIVCPPFDESVYYLGPLCRKKHEWGNTGQTLRKILCNGKYLGKCVTCVEADRAQKKAEVERKYKEEIDSLLSDPSIVCPSFDEQKYYLGSLCKNKHVWGNTNKTLKSKTNHNCPRCTRDRVKATAIRTPDNEIEPGKYLGSLCKNGHTYQGQQKTLRYMSTGQCITCAQIDCENRDRSHRYSEETRGVYILGKLCPKGHDHECTGMSLRRLDNRSCLICSYERNEDLTEEERIARNKYVSDRFKERYHSDPRYREEHLRKQSERYHSDPIFQAKQRLRALMYEARKIDAQGEFYTLEDCDRKFELFNGCCGYCGKEIDTSIYRELQWDHVLPFILGGLDEMSNLIPSCMSCNTSKQGKEMLGWYIERPYFSWERLIFILENIDYDQAIQIGVDRLKRGLVRIKIDDRPE